MSIRRNVSRLLALLKPKRLDDDLDEHIRMHLVLAEDDAIARGLSPETARLEARRHFGGISQMKEEHRDRRSFRWFEWVVRDFRYGLASLKRTPGFAAIVISVLALGIGATVAMFSIVDAVLLKPLPFPNPQQIVSIWEAPRPGSFNATTVPQFLEWQRLSQDFATLAAEQSFSAALKDQTGPTVFPGKRVTSGYFKVFGINAAIGRTFLSNEDQPGAEPAVVLSHAAWQAHFAADPAILSRRVWLDGQNYQVIGVLESGAFDREETQFWTPLVFHASDMSGKMHWLTLFARLHADVTPERAGQKMQAIYQALVTNPLMDEDPKWSAVVMPLSQILLGRDLRLSVMVAFGAVLLVLLIACANVANLLFARGAARRTELAVRSALGAGRMRLTAQLLIECLALCVLGGAAGVAVAFALIRLAKPVLALQLPYTADVQVDLHALLFGGAVVLGVALLTGALPAWQGSFGDLANSLKQATRSSSGAHLKLRRSIVIAEVALSFVLLCGALLLGRSLLNLQHVETGVRIENVTTTSVDLPSDAYPTPEKAALFGETLAARLRTIPGVINVGLTNFLPLHWISNGEGIFVPGVEKQVMVRLKRIDPGYLRTLDIPVLAGRGIAEQDRIATPGVMLINQALAKRLAAAANIQQPVGTPVRLTGSTYLSHEAAYHDTQIVGVIRNERTTSAGAPDPAVVYVPLAQLPSSNVNLLVRTQDIRSAAVMPAIREAVHEIDPNLPLGEVATMQEIKDATFSGISRPAWLMSAFAATAMLLAAIGLYGVIAFSMTQRRKELGIRVALGARPGNVLLQVLRDALQMISWGLALGLVGAYALTRILASFLFQVSPVDPLSLTVGCLSMILIGLAAAFVPARRAARFDPMLSLREDT